MNIDAVKIVYHASGGNFVFGKLNKNLSVCLAVNIFCRSVKYVDRSLCFKHHICNNRFV